MTDEEKKAVDKLKRSANYFVMPMHETTIILNLIEKQDKIINKMAEYLAKEDVTETFCINHPTDSDCDYAGKKCEDCIIEYFSKKVGEKSDG